MQECCRRYLEPSFFEAREKVVVLEVGSADVNGGYREMFSHPKIEYCGADLIETRGVDIVLKSPYEIPLPDAYVDLVISGQMLEHCAYFWLSFREMVRTLKPDGLLFLIAPSAGPIHRYPVDCYRFYPDAYKALADLAGCYLVESWLDQRGPWKDLVGVFSKQQRPKWAGDTAAGQTSPKPAVTTEKGSWLTRPWNGLVGVFSKQRRPKEAVPSPSGRALREHDAQGEKSPSAIPPVIYDGDPVLNVVSGAASYLDLLKIIHGELTPRLYLEIGVGEGASLELSGCKSIGIDPEPRLAHRLSERVKIHPRTSDDFFALEAAHAIPDKIDLAFINGMHMFECALRDFFNIEKYSMSTSLVVVDGIFPNHPLQASRLRRSRVWTGDVWKLLTCLRTFRPDLILIPVDTSPAGSLLIARLDPSNQELIDKYNPIMGRFVTKGDDSPPRDALTRRSAIQPNDRRIIKLLQLLKSCRDQCSGEQVIRERLGVFANGPLASNGDDIKKR